MAEPTYIITPTDKGGMVRNAPTALTAPGPYVEYGWALRLECTSAIASATLELRALILDIDGERTPIAQTMTITGTGIQTGVQVGVGRGWIIGLSVRATAGTITDSDLTCSVHVVRNAGATLEYLMTLASGNVTRTRSLGLNAYTGVGGSSETETLAPTGLAVADPAAGAEFTITVPAGQIWEVMGARFIFTASATAATREMSVQIDDGTNMFLHSKSPTTQTANIVRGYNVGQYGVVYTPALSTTQNLNLPPMFMGPGWRLLSQCSNLQANDQYSAIALSYLLH